MREVKKVSSIFVKVTTALAKVSLGKIDKTEYIIAAAPQQARWTAIAFFLLRSGTPFRRPSR